MCVRANSSSCVPARPLRSGARAAAAAGQRLAVHDVAHEELARLLAVFPTPTLPPWPSSTHTYNDSKRYKDGEAQAVRVADARRGHVELAVGEALRREEDADALERLALRLAVLAR